MRHASLENDVMIICVRFHYCEPHFKSDIYVQKLKAKKLI